MAGPPCGTVHGVASARLSVRLTPGASRAGIAGFTDGVLSVRVSAPAQEGRANAALLKLLSKALGVSASRLTIVFGEHARTKVVSVDGLTQAELDARARDAAP